MAFVGSDFRSPRTVVSTILSATVVNAVFVVVVVVGVVVAGVVIGVVVIVGVAVVLNVSLITITASAICTVMHGSDFEFHHVVVDVVNVVVIYGLVVVATRVILDLLFVVSGVVMNIVVLIVVARVVTYIISPIC